MPEAEPQVTFTMLLSDLRSAMDLRMRNLTPAHNGSILAGFDVPSSLLDEWKQRPINRQFVQMDEDARLILYKGGVDKNEALQAQVKDSTQGTTWIYSLNITKSPCILLAYCTHTENGDGKSTTRPTTKTKRNATKEDLLLFGQMLSYVPILSDDEV